MSRRVADRRMADKRAALREKLARTRAALAARRRTKRRDRRWAWLLLLLLFFVPPCDEPAPEAVAPGLPAVVAPAAAGVAAPTPPEAPTPTKVKKRDRPAFPSPAPGPPPWVDSFRLQVAARSPRLAPCFAGADRPGALRWSAAVEPVRGRISDQALEPTLAGDALTAEQRTCVFAAMADPPYRLDPAGAPSTPARVGMVLEF